MPGGPDNSAENQQPLRRILRWVAALNCTYFGIEFTIAVIIRSVSLFADSIDFLEDTAVNLLVLIALGWSASRRARAGMGLAALLLLPGVATLWTAGVKLLTLVPPAPIPLSLTGTGALLVNFTCASLLMRFRSHGGSLTKAAFLSARNDVLANITIIVAGP